MAGDTPPFTFRHYVQILEAGLEAGYHFIGFQELETVRRSRTYLCLLRHDCEGDLGAAARLAKLESDRGISSTYFVQLRSPLYNPLSKPHKSLIDRLLNLGHWLGLHFDEHSHTFSSNTELVDKVDLERNLLGAEFGVSVDVVSFHQPSALVLDNRVQLRCMNTYDRSDMVNVDYLSDSRWQWREDPIEAFRSRRHPHLQLLLHPECWTDNKMSPEGKWHQVLRNNLDIAQDTLLSREDTYKRKAVITFRS